MSRFRCGENNGSGGRQGREVEGGAPVQRRAGEHVGPGGVGEALGQGECGVGVGVSGERVARDDGEERVVGAVLLADESGEGEPVVRIGALRF